MIRVKSLAVFGCLLLLASGRLVADTVTLPVAASVVGVAPFFSDVRVFNTSYSASVSVTAVYRFGVQPVRVFTLGPRESRSFDNICVSLFGVPNSLGAVEFTSSAPAGTVVVTSRLYSPVATGGAVGMFIPGLPSSSAKVVTVLSGLMNGASRTNVGVYNPNDVSVTATVRLFDGEVLLGAVPVVLGPKGQTQVSNIYKTVGFETLVRTDGYVTVDSGNAAVPLFTYAAIADNATQDTILVVGAEDVAAPFGFNPPTPTPSPGGPAASPTPTPTRAPTSTPTPPGSISVSLVATQFQWSFDGAGPDFTMRVGQTYQLQIRDGDPPGNVAHGFGGTFKSGSPQLVSSRALSAGGPAVTVIVTPQSNQVGVHSFACDQSSCGTGHNDMLGTITVSP